MDASKNAPRVRILGTGHYSPARILSNAELEKMVDTTDEWIVARTGIRQRRIAADDEQSSDMAVAACKGALEMAGVTAKQIDLIVVGTISPDLHMPSCAVYVQRRLGVPPGCAFDVSAACAGFLYAMGVAEKFIAGGQSRYALVVGVELLSRFTDWKDRGTCILFGDGAGAVVLGRPDPSDPREQAEGGSSDRGIVSTHLYADGAYADSLTIQAGGTRYPVSAEAVEKRMGFIKMAGQEIFKVAVRNMTASLEMALSSAGWKPEEVDWVVAHQANLRILDQIVLRMKIPKDRFFLNIEKYGNTSSASIPIALDEAVRAGLIRPGHKLLFTALGAGVAWGSAAVVW